MGSSQFWLKQANKKKVSLQIQLYFPVFLRKFDRTLCDRALPKDNSGQETQWAFLTKYIGNLGPGKHLPIPLHYRKGPYLPEEGTFFFEKKYGPFSTGPLPELSLINFIYCS